MPRRLSIALTLAAALTGALMLPTAASAQECASYSCADYAQHDVDNYTRGRAKMYSDASNPEYAQKFVGACADTQSRAIAKQVEDADDARVYGGVGQATCWWSVGDAADYNKVRPQRITFLSRTGAKLQGHIWTAADSGRRPGIVITTGSIQASDQMYWWAARALAARGYNVMTFDVQGQGQSETAGHAPGDVFPTTEGVPSQQAANFYDGTIDALRYFLSTPDRPYAPQGWTAADVAAAKAGGDGDEVSWSNPGFGRLDRKRLGIAGHSLGASAISNVQMCSDKGELWRTLPLCGGRSFPIKAAVAWDALSGSESVTPVVPAMSQQADGYFLFPTFAPNAPDPAESLEGFARWDAVGLDVFSYVVRAGTHIEWSQVPYTPATTYGAAMNTFYTLAWFDRWVPRQPDRRRAGFRALVEGPKADPAKGGVGAANFMSTRRYSAFAITRPGTSGERLRTTDVRAWAGRSKVGDFAGSNADTAGKFTPTP